MTERAAPKLNARIVDLAILAPPINRRDGGRELALFTLLCAPLWVRDCVLIARKGKAKAGASGFDIKTPSGDVRIQGWASDLIAGQAARAYREALATLPR